MNEVTRILGSNEDDSPQAAMQLLPLVYDELRRLAAGYMANESPGQTLNATALVHEAYLRLVGPGGERAFVNRGHFFAAAAEAMRPNSGRFRRSKNARKRGGGRDRTHFELGRLPAPAEDAESWIDLDDALTAFQAIDASAAELAKLRIFGGLSVEESAQVLAISRATAFRVWTYARAWLTAALVERVRILETFQAPSTPCRVKPRVGPCPGA